MKINNFVALKWLTKRTEQKSLCYFSRKCGMSLNSLFSYMSISISISDFFPTTLPSSFSRRQLNSRRMKRGRIAGIRSGRYVTQACGRTHVPKMASARWSIDAGMRTGCCMCVCLFARACSCVCFHLALFSPYMFTGAIFRHHPQLIHPTAKRQQIFLFISSVLRLYLCHDFPRKEFWNQLFVHALLPIFDVCFRNVLFFFY